MSVSLNTKQYAIQVLKRNPLLQGPRPPATWEVPDELPPNLPKLQMDVSVTTLPLFPADSSAHSQDNSAYNILFKRLQECTQDRRRFALRNALDCVVAVVIASDEKPEVDLLRNLIGESSTLISPLTMLSISNLMEIIASIN